MNEKMKISLGMEFAIKLVQDRLIDRQLIMKKSTAQWNPVSKRDLRVFEDDLHANK